MAGKIPEGLTRQAKTRNFQLPERSWKFPDYGAKVHDNLCSFQIQAAYPLAVGCAERIAGQNLPS